MTSPFTLTPEQEAEVLTFDPWGERDSTYRTLRSAFATCRKAHRCEICLGVIVVGERAWAKTEVDHGQAATFRFCAECCWCIAHRCDESADDDDDPNSAFMRMEDRWEIGRKRADSEVPK